MRYLCRLQSKGLEVVLSFGLFYGEALPGVHDHLEEGAVVEG